MKPFSAAILPVLVILGLVAGCSNPSNSGSQVGPGDSSSSVIAGDDDSEPSASNDFGTITGPNGVAIPGGPYGDPLGKVICITGMVSESGSSYAGKTIRLFVTNNMTTLTGILDVSVAIGQGKISETGSAAVGLFDFSPKADQAVCALIVIYDETGYVGAWQTITHTSLFASFDEVTFIKLDCKELGVAILPVSR